MPPARSFLYVLLLSLLTLGLGGSAQAYLVAEDAFDYDTGSLNGLADGYGWSDAWAGSSQVTSPGMEYGSGLLNLLAAGNKVNGASATFRTVDLAAVPDLVDGSGIGADDTTLWISFIAHRPTEGSDQWGGIALFDGGGERLFIGKPFNQGTWGFDTKANGVHTSSVPVQEEALLVTRIDFNASGNEDLWMWVNPALDIEPAIALADVTTGRSNFRFNRVRIASGVSGGIDFDELRLGTSFRDVAPIPEPASLALLGAGLLALRRRRR